MNLQPASARASRPRHEPTLIRSEAGEPSDFPWLDSAVCPRCQAANDAAATICCECGSDLALGRPSRPINYYIGFDPERAAGARYSLQIAEAELEGDDGPAWVGAPDVALAAAPSRARPAAASRPQVVTLFIVSVVLAGVAVMLAAAASVRHYLHTPLLESGGLSTLSSQALNTGPKHEAVEAPPASVVPIAIAPSATSTAAEAAGSILGLPPAPPTAEPVAVEQAPRPAIAVRRTRPQPQSAPIERQAPPSIVCTQAAAALALCDAPSTDRSP